MHLSWFFTSTLWLQMLFHIHSQNHPLSSMSLSMKLFFPTPLFNFSLSVPMIFYILAMTPPYSLHIFTSLLLLHPLPPPIFVVLSHLLEVNLHVYLLVTYLVVHLPSLPHLSPFTSLTLTPLRCLSNPPFLGLLFEQIQ